MIKNKALKVLAFTTLIASISGCWNVSEGHKTGIIVKLAQTGAFVKTWEAELIRGGFNSGSGVNGQSFHFTIESKEMAQKLMMAFESQSEVIIKYHEEAITGCSRGETKVFLDAFTVV